MLLWWTCSSYTFLWWTCTEKETRLKISTKLSKAFGKKIFLFFKVIYRVPMSIWRNAFWGGQAVGCPVVLFWKLPKLSAGESTAALHVTWSCAFIVKSSRCSQRESQLMSSACGWYFHVGCHFDSASVCLSVRIVCLVNNCTCILMPKNIAWSIAYHSHLSLELCYDCWS